MSDKYDVKKISADQGSFDISDEGFYRFIIDKAGLHFISTQFDEVKRFLVEDEEFSRDNNSLDNAYHDDLLEDVTGETHAAFILRNAKSIVDDEYYKDSDQPLLEEGRRAYADDVFANSVEIFESMKEEYENIIESMDDVLAGFKSGSIEFDGADSLHIAVAQALADDNHYDGGLVSVVEQFQQDDVEYPMGCIGMETATNFASELAAHSIYDGIERGLYPEPTKPGSVEEAVALSYFLTEDEKVSSICRGGPLGHQGIDSRSDPEIEVRVFREYTHNMICKALSYYEEPIKHVGLFDEANALKAAKISGPEADAFIEAHFEERGAPASAFQTTRALLANISESVQSGNAKVEQYADLAKARHLDGFVSTELKDYLGVMHPEIARQVELETTLDLRSMSTMLMGLMDGTQASKAELNRLKDTLGEKVPTPNKALGVFRALVYPEQEQKLDGPGIR